VNLENKLRDLQDNIRNAGWRIQHIPWQPEGKLEVYKPGNLLTWFLILSGFVCFFGGAILFSPSGFPVWIGIAVMILGLVLLITSRFSAGRHQYDDFVSVEAICLDREVQEFEDPDSVGSLIKNTFWEPRILCEYRYKGKRYRVTPIVVITVAFHTDEGVTKFLDERINGEGKCRLWINPMNPLHTVFHLKPKTGPHTA
jgi:hypothetical protein